MTKKERASGREKLLQEADGLTQFIEPPEVVRRSIKETGLDETDCLLPDLVTCEYVYRSSCLPNRFAKFVNYF